MTTDGFALAILAIGGLIVFVGGAALYWQERRRQGRVMAPPDWVEPVSLADWRQRAEESQRRSDERRTK